MTNSMIGKPIQSLKIRSRIFQVWKNFDVCSSFSLQNKSDIIFKVNKLQEKL